MDASATPRWKRLSAGLLALWLLCSPSGLVFAGPVADAAAAASQRPTVTTTRTGLPLVNIATPNAAGQSYNRYRRFDVDPAGLILNNSRTAGVTALGDQIAANPNLTSRTANLIVNEVVSALPSPLNGPLSIFGDAAQLVIVNPNGITCNGCAFLNTGHVTLTTGQVRWLDAPGGNSADIDQAAAIGFTVSDGQILVTGSGLASPLARLDLIAQTLKVDAPIDVGTGSLNLLAGRQTVDHLTLAQRASDSTNNRADIGGDWAIDATVFGAMNAGSIRIVSTAAGMGVRSDRALAATTGDLVISANGDLTLKSVGAARHLALSTPGTLTHAGLGANGHLTVAADTLNNAGQQIIAQGDVTLTAPHVDNSGGQVLAGGQLSVTATASSLDLAAERLAGAGGLDVHARALSNSGAFAHAAAVTLKADTTFTNSGTLRSNGAVNIQAGTAFTNSGLLRARTLTLGTNGTLSNSGTLLALSEAVLASDDIINTGRIQSTAALRLIAGNVTLTTRWHGHWGEWHGGLKQGYAWKDDWGTTVSGHTPATVQVAGALNITAPSQSNSGNLRSGSLWLGGVNISNGLHDYTYQTPDSTLPASQMALGLGAASGPVPALTVPAGGTYTPQGATFFTSASRLALLSLPPGTLNDLLPPELRPSGTPYLLDGWLEDQAIRQAALSEAGRASFLTSNDPNQERATLYQNAAKYARANHIPLGVTLSAAQIAALAEPILWYVEQDVTGPDGQAHRVLVPRLYLPDSTRHDLASIAGGTLRADDITIKASDRVDNSGFIVAGQRLNVQADTLINQKRSADVTNGGPALRQYLGNVGYWETTGSTVQPGGFMSAATLSLNAERIESISGEFFENGQDATARLQQQLGRRFTQSQNQDNIQQVFVTMQKKDGMASIAVLVVAMVVAFYTAGAVSGLIASAAESSALAAGMTAAQATAAGVAAASSTSSMMLAAAASATASSATTQLLTTGRLDAGQMLKAGATGALTAGLLNMPLSDGGQSLNQLAGIQDVAGTGAKLARFNVDTLGSNVLGMAGRGLVTAGVNTAAYGGSFGTAFKQSVISDLQAVGASAIGQNWGGGQAPVRQTALHAALGVTAATLQGQDAVAGAIGAATESVLGNLIDLPTDTTGHYSGTTRMLYAAGAMLTGGAAAEAAGRDGVTAATAAQNAATNNRLATQLEKDRFRQLAKDDPAKAARYQDAACTLIKCSALFPAGSEKWRYWQQAERRGAFNTAELGELKQVQATDPSFLKYGFFDQVGDVAWRGVERGAQAVDLAGQSTVNAVKSTALGVAGAAKEVVDLSRDTLTAYGNTMAYVAGDDEALHNPFDPHSRIVKAVADKGIVQATVDAGTRVIVSATNLPRGIGAGDPVLAGEGLAFWAPVAIGSLNSLIANATRTGAASRVVGESLGAASNEGALSYYMQQARTLNVSTSENASVFYSGSGNRILAEQFAKTNGRTTLEMTPGGRWLDAQKLYSPNSPMSPTQATQVWSTLSERFAAGASGNAVGFTQGSRTGSIFNTVEFPTLLKNPRVTNVLTGGH